MAEKNPLWCFYGYPRYKHGMNLSSHSLTWVDWEPEGPLRDHNLRIVRVVLRKDKEIEDLRNQLMALINEIDQGNMELSAELMRKEQEFEICSGHYMQFSRIRKNKYIPWLMKYNGIMLLQEPVRFTAPNACCRYHAYSTGGRTCFSGNEEKWQKRPNKVGYLPIIPHRLQPMKSKL